MRAIPFYLPALIILLGCGTEPYIIKDFSAGTRRETLLGYPMITVENGLKYTVAGNVQSAYKYEFIYRGMADSVITLAYRETQVGEEQSRSRPASATQESQFDIKTSRRVYFHDAILEILEVHQNRIVFIVIQSPEDALILRW